MQYKSVLTFSILKYIEIIVTAVTTFILAKKIGPAQMGYAVPVLLYITYANYLALGLNQVVIKNYSRISEEGEVAVKRFIGLNMQYLLIISFVNILIAYFFIDSSLFVATSVVSSSILIRGFFSSYFRAIMQIKILNKNNLIYSILLLAGVVFLAESWYSYMLIWAGSMITALLLYYLDGRRFFSSILRRIHIMPTKLEILYNFSEGLKLAAAGLITTVLLTADRFLIIRLPFTIEEMGVYQLADYCAMAVYMVVTTVLFYYYPGLIKRIRDTQIFRRKVVELLKKFLLAYPLLMMLIYVVLKLSVVQLFPEFKNLDGLAILTVFSKLNVVLLSFVSLLYIGVDKESKYIKTMLPLLLIIIVVFFAIERFYMEIDMFHIPVVLGIILFTDLIFKLFVLVPKDILKK